MSLTKSGSTTLFRYDALGHQVSRSVNGVVTGYGYDGDQIILEQQGVRSRRPTPGGTG